MQIFIQKDIENTNPITLQVERSDTIDIVKDKIQDMEGFPPNEQYYLIFEDDKILEDGTRTLGSLSIKDGDALHLYLYDNNNGITSSTVAD
ncbi:hypothetical protein Scep_028719 [Stephania cephalantha]|uniref:Ubiquitin-like domain-containing protein n=1 Tax=Stephania cephalantha TaxID=152367 RepID=A0AAP0HM25_9MAGN